MLMIIHLCKQYPKNIEEILFGFPIFLRICKGVKQSVSHTYLFHNIKQRRCIRFKQKSAIKSINVPSHIGTDVECLCEIVLNSTLVASILGIHRKVSCHIMCTLKVILFIKSCDDIVS